MLEGRTTESVANGRRRRAVLSAIPSVGPCQWRRWVLLLLVLVLVLALLLLPLPLPLLLPLLRWLECTCRAKAVSMMVFGPSVVGAGWRNSWCGEEAAVGVGVK